MNIEKQKRERQTLTKAKLYHVVFHTSFSWRKIPCHVKKKRGKSRHTHMHAGELRRKFVMHIQKTCFSFFLGSHHEYISSFSILILHKFVASFFVVEKFGGGVIYELFYGSPHFWKNMARSIQCAPEGERKKRRGKTFRRKRWLRKKY